MIEIRFRDEMIQAVQCEHYTANLYINERPYWAPKVPPYSIFYVDQNHISIMSQNYNNTTEYFTDEFCDIFLMSAKYCRHIGRIFVDSLYEIREDINDDYIKEVGTLREIDEFIKANNFRWGVVREYRDSYYIQETLDGIRQVAIFQGTYEECLEYYNDDPMLAMGSYNIVHCYDYDVDYL